MLAYRHIPKPPLPARLACKELLKHSQSFPQKQEWGREATVHVQLVLRMTLKLKALLLGIQKPSSPCQEKGCKSVEKTRSFLFCSKKNEGKTTL